VPCTLNRKNEGDVIGCCTHGRTRKDTKWSYAILHIWHHCWCGLDLQPTYNYRAGWSYEVYEKPICTPEKHFSKHPNCTTYNRYSEKHNKMCGWHGLSFDHCRLCLDPILDPKKDSLAKRILRALRPS